MYIVAHKSQKRMLKPLELELKAAVTSSMGSGTKAHIYHMSRNALSCWTITLAPYTTLRSSRMNVGIKYTSGH